MENHQHFKLSLTGERENLHVHLQFPDRSIIITVFHDSFIAFSSFFVVELYYVKPYILLPKIFGVRTSNKLSGGFHVS